MLGLVNPVPGRQPVVTKPVHNRDGTVWALAKQMLMDLDLSRETTAVPTPTLELLLTTVRDMLERPPADPHAAAQREAGLMLEGTSNPNLRYWQRRAEEDADAAASDE